jgi:hypothetical protein
MGCAVVSVQNETHTGKKAASTASKELKSSKSSKSEKTVAGSELSQAKKGGAKKK